MSLNLGFIVFVVSEPLPLAYCSINLPTVLLPAGDPAVVLDGLAGVLGELGAALDELYGVLAGLSGTLVGAEVFCGDGFSSGLFVFAGLSVIVASEVDKLSGV